MDNSINFKGAFLVKRPTPKLKDSIISVIKNKPQQVFDNITGKGDMLFVVRNSLDKDIAQVLRMTPNVKFKYYPTLSTKSGFDTQKPEEAKNILRAAANTAITTKNKLIEAVRKPLNLAKTSIRITQEKNLKLMQKETFLDFSDSKYQKNIDVQTGVCTIKTYTKDIITGNKKKHTLLTITPPGKFGICYAKYVPVSLEEPTRRIAIKNGTKVLEYVTSDSERYMDYLSGEYKNQQSIDKRFEQYVKEAKDYYKTQKEKKSDEGIIA